MMTCEICSEALTIYGVDNSGTVYVCLNQHWWLSSPTLGWLIVPPPTTEPVAAVPWQITDLGGLSVYLHPSTLYALSHGEAVFTWPDSASIVSAATATSAPTWDAVQSAVRFDAAQAQYFSLPHAPLSGDPEAFVWVGQIDDIGSNMYIMGNDTTGGRRLWYVTSADDVRWYSGDDQIHDSPAMTTGVPVLLSGSLETGAYDLAINGVHQTGATAVPMTASIGRELGAHELGWQSFNGLMWALALFTKPYYNDDLQRAEGVLAHEFGLAELLPLDHPYRDAPPMIAGSS